MESFGSRENISDQMAVGIVQTDGIKTSGRINSLDALRRVFLGDPFIPAVNAS